MNIQNILFATDFSKVAENSLDHALILAHHFEASLTILHVEVPFGGKIEKLNAEMENLDGRMIFAGANQKTESMLAISNLTSVFAAYSDIETAISAFR